MTSEQKAIIANSVIGRLNDVVIKRNKQLCRENLHYKQTPLHGFGMFIDLMAMDDDKFNEIAKLTGV